MKICIESNPDGTFSVYEDVAMPADPAAAEAGAPATPAGEPIATLDEALATARQMLEGGKANSPEALFTNAKPAESMQQGFEKARGNQMY